ncbi:cytidine deaminase [candidate division KSB1 bacterium]|nr:cytidine deaminase [candidate division KSB1 bacterium]RQW07600.1 MAG: cytidine deaminase [candidate division KSB1 bacterium]
MEFEQLISAATRARATALAPYSHFPVGAALQTRAGKIYTGCNIESSSYGLTMCAERVALFKALSDGERQFSAIAIAAAVDRFCPPCGACRQVLWDFARDITVILLSLSSERKILKMTDLFPHAFDDGFLIHD